MTVADHLRRVWKGRYRIIGVALVTAGVGVGLSFVLPPVYQSNALIQPREGGQQTLLGLSGLGSQSGGQLTKLEVALKSRDLAYDVLEDHPEFLGALFPKSWDTVKSDWKPGVERPGRMDRSGALRKLLKVKSILREGVISVSIEAPDPALARNILAAYLESLNARMRMAEKLDADSNRAYLEREFDRTQDPMLRARMQSLISSEFDRAHLVHTRAFEIVEAPALFEQRVRPKRRKMVVGFFAAGLLLGAASLYAGIVRGELTRRLRASGAG